MQFSKQPAYCCGLTAVLLAFGATGCGQSKPAAPAATPPDVSVQTVHASNVPVSVELPGRTAPYRVAQVRARVDGVVQQRTFEEGADVTAHQLLYRIDPAPYRAALANATAALQKANANLVAMTAQAERYKTLVGGNAISKQTYDNAVAAQGQAAADVAAGKASVDTARINLGYTDVVSPIAGRSAISQVTEGAYVQASAATLLTTVQQIDPIYVDLTQSSVAGLHLRADIASGKLQPQGGAAPTVKLTLEDGSPYPLAGKLKFSGITVDPATGTVTVRAEFPNPRHVLLPGMFVHASIEQGDARGAILVPAPAVTHDASGQATTLVVGTDNKVALRTLQAQTMYGNDWVVTAGLKDGDRVVVAGVQQAQPGKLVHPVAAAGPAPAPAPAGTTATAPAATSSTATAATAANPAASANQ